MDIRQTHCPSRHKGALWGFRGQPFKIWRSCQTARPIGTNFCFTSADSSGNGHRLNPSRPQYTRGHFEGGRGSQIDWHQIWFKSADSTSAKYNSPLNTLWGFRGSQITNTKSMLKLSNGWTDWHQIWHTFADSSGNGYTPNKLPFETQGDTWGLEGQTFKSLEKLSNGSIDWHQMWYMSADSSGN